MRDKMSKLCRNCYNELIEVTMFKMTNAETRFWRHKSNPFVKCTKPQPKLKEE